MRVLNTRQRQIMVYAIETWITSFETVDVNNTKALAALVESQSAKPAILIDVMLCKQIGVQAEDIDTLRSKIDTMRDFLQYLLEKSQIDVQSLGFCEHIKKIRLSSLLAALECQRDIFFDSLPNIIPSPAWMLSWDQGNFANARKEIAEKATQLCDAEQMIQFFTDHIKSGMYGWTNS